MLRVQLHWRDYDFRGNRQPVGPGLPVVMHGPIFRFREKGTCALGLIKKRIEEYFPQSAIF